MLAKLPYFFAFFLLWAGSVAYCQNQLEQKPSKEELIDAILDPNVDEVEALELMAKYYPELLNPVVEAGKDFDQANTVQNAKESGDYYLELGQRSLDRKDYDQAIAYFQTAIVKKQQTLGGSEIHPDISKSYRGLGKAHEGKKEFEKALESYQRGLRSNASGFDETDLLKNPEVDNIISNQLAIPIFESKGDVLLKSDRNENRLLAALIAYERAIEVIETVCRKYTSEDSKLALTEELVLLSEKAIQAALKLYKNTRNPAYKDRSYRIAEKGKAMVLTATLLEKGYLPDVPENLYRKEQQLKTTIAQLSQKIKRQKTDDKSAGKIEQQLFSLNQALYFLQDTLKTYYPKAIHLKHTPPNIAIDSLQRFLGNQNAALVEYFIGPNVSYVFTVTGDNLEIERLEDIEEAKMRVITLRKDLQSQNFKNDAAQSVLDFISHAGALYSLTLEKALQGLDDDIRELIIIPDAMFWFLPFELLLYEQVSTNKADFSADHMPYLIDKYTISYAHSAKLLLNSVKRNRNSDLIAFAGFAPEFTDNELASRSCLGEGARLGKLKHNQTELENIRKHFEGEAYFGNQASRKNFLKATAKTEIIHCSTHACINEDDPMRNRIFFANDEYLTTEDIYLLNTKAKMAVLSACQTGLGTIRNGEGVISLARAFTYAGCSSITMSLWPVADEATSELMTRYYDGLDEGLTKSQALRQAKLNYLKKQTKAKQHPYYWAAFVHLGDFSPIKTSKARGIPFWVLGLLGVVIVGWLVGRSRKNDKV